MIALGLITSPKYLFINLFKHAFVVAPRVGTTLHVWKRRRNTQECISLLHGM